jgi:hypothetical protein
MSKKRKPLLNGDRGELGKYVRHMADLMGLCSWLVMMKPGNPDGDDWGAMANVIHGRQVVNLWFRDGWDAWSADELRQTVCHELLHAHMNPLAHGILNRMAESIGKPAYEQAWAAMEEHLELVVDRIATVWAETLPLPVKATGDA